MRYGFLGHPSHVLWRPVFHFTFPFALFLVHHSVLHAEGDVLVDGNIVEGIAGDGDESAKKLGLS